MAVREKRARALEHYRTCIKTAEKWRKDEGYDDLWQRLVDLYSGKHFPAGLSTEDRIAVNLAFSTVNVIAPSVSVNHPKVTVAARQPEDEDKGVILEAVVNYWWRHFKIQPQFRMAVKDYLIIGHGWLKTGYRFVEEAVDRPQEDVDAEYEKLRGEADSYAHQNPDMAGGLPTDEEILANVTSTEMRIVEDRPFVERVSPRDVYVDPEATCPEDMKWIAQKVIKPLSEVRDNKRYQAHVRNNLEADSTLTAAMRLPEGSKKKYDDGVARVTVWEYYDLRAGTMCVFADAGADDFLLKPQKQPYAFGHPFVMLRNYDVPDHFYPMGDLEAIEPLQQELNKTRSQMLNHRKQYTPKILYKRENFGRQAQADLTSEVPFTMVAVEGNIDLREAAVPLQFPQLPPDFYQQSDVISNDINVVTGLNEYERGQMPEIRRTATEASIIQDAANARAADKLAQVELVISDIASRLVQLAQQYLTGEQVARVIGANGAPIWIPYDRDDISGEFDFEVEGGSTQPQNDTFRRQQATQMLQVLQPFMGPPGSGMPIDGGEMLKYALKYAFGISNPERFMAKPMDPSMMAPPGGPPGEGGEPPPEGEAPPEDSAVQGVPPELAAQLQGQVGVNFG